MRVPVALFSLFLLAACGPAEPPAPTPAPPTSPSAAPQASAPVILVVGTSLTAGLGLDPSDAWPARLQEKIDAAGLSYRVVNAGSSGETSAGARRRIEWLMKQPVAVLIVETGANDALRGQDPDAVRDNIQAIFDRAREQTPPPRLVLAAMEAPPNYGEDYARRFRGLYPELARENDALLLPFLLEGVAGIPALNQPDGIHPTAEGQRRIADNVWTTLQPIL